MIALATLVGLEIVSFRQKVFDRGSGLVARHDGLRLFPGLLRARKRWIAAVEPYSGS
jgi:hypothetical protein